MCGDGFALNSDKHKCDGKSGSQHNQEKFANGVSQCSLYSYRAFIDY